MIYQNFDLMFNYTWRHTISTNRTFWQILACFGICGPIWIRPISIWSDSHQFDFFFILGVNFYVWWKQKISSYLVENLGKKVAKKHLHDVHHFIPNKLKIPIWNHILVSKSNTYVSTVQLRNHSFSVIMKIKHDIDCG